MDHHETDLPPLALTMGEPAGIGPELALKIWHKRQNFKTPPFVLIASKTQMKRCADELGYNVICQEIDHAAEAMEIFDRALPLLPLAIDCDVSPGHLDPSAAPCIIGAIKNAVRLALSGEVSGIVTNPIHKKNLYDSGFAYPGHTEFLSHLSNPSDPKPRPVMMLQGGGLRTVPVTIHMALADVPAALTPELIVATVEIVHRDLIRCFGIERPRLVVSGLNPHAGEDGALGAEDMTTIKPAIELLKSQGLDIRGPLPADTMFHEKARQHYDAAVCMYHDQALIPVKTLGFDTGVNITLGLDFIRTSPDHGTACDIAGQNKADPRSLVAALKTAAQMAACKVRYTQKNGG
jgi:4-hydroxythreonine-4-phosphate dehydrogenase